MKKLLLAICILAVLFSLSACGGKTDEKALSGGVVSSTGGSEALEESQALSGQSGRNTENFSASNGLSEENTMVKMNVQVGNSSFLATLEKNAAVDSFIELMRESPVVIQMSDHSGFEKVGAIGTSLPTRNSQTTTKAGDIVLYSRNQIVIFYGSNSWSYTRLGKIDDLTGWKEALGSGDVEVIFSIAP